MEKEEAVVGVLKDPPFFSDLQSGVLYRIGIGSIFH